MYLSQNMFLLRSNMVLSTVNTQGHYLRLFISHVNNNFAQYAFFHRTAMLQRVLTYISTQLLSF